MPAGLKRNGRLKKGFKFLKGGRVVKAKTKRRAAAKSTRRAPTRTKRRTTRRKSNCVAFALPRRGRGGRFVKRRR